MTCPRLLTRADGCWRMPSRALLQTDSIMKTIATTGSIVLTTVLNAAFLSGPFTLPIWAGGLVVVVSVFNYNDNGEVDRG